jgi:hypothetical protein
MYSTYIYLIYTLFITIVLYLLFYFLLKNTHQMAFDRSIFISLNMFLYLIFFGLGFPDKYNPNLNFDL